MVGANDNGFDLVSVHIELAHSGISIEPTDITGAFAHQNLTSDRDVVSGDPVTLPFVLSGSASSTVSGDLSEVSTVSSDLLEWPEVSLVSSDLLGAPSHRRGIQYAAQLQPV